MDQARPVAEIEIDEGLAEALLITQCPEFASGPLERAGEGWDNITFRVGDDLALRIPRREVAVDLLLNEQRWLPELANQLDTAVPLPVFRGAPSHLFRWPWSVVPWIPGQPLGVKPLPPAAAPAFAGLLRALHRAAPPDAPRNKMRGVPLQDRRSAIEGRLNRLADGHLDCLWARALSAEPSVQSQWFHGDLHPGNVVIRDERVVGVIDWGDLGAGDVATDLACGWTLFDEAGRKRLFRHYKPTEGDVDRALGWAIHFGTALSTSGDSDHEVIGREVIKRLHETAV